MLPAFAVVWASCSVRSTPAAACPRWHSSRLTGRTFSHAQVLPRASARPHDLAGFRQRLESAALNGKCEGWCERRFRHYPLVAQKHCSNKVCAGCGYCADLLQSLRRGETPAALRLRTGRENHKR